MGKNGNEIPELVKLGHEIYENEGIHTLFATLDHVSASIVKRLIEEAFNEGVIVRRVDVGYHWKGRNNR